MVKATDTKYVSNGLTFNVAMIVNCSRFGKFSRPKVKGNQNMDTRSGHEQSYSTRPATVVNTSEHDVQSILKRYGNAAQSLKVASPVYGHEHDSDSGNRRG